MTSTTITHLSAEDKIRIQLDAVIESYEQREWTALVPFDLPVTLVLIVVAMIAFMVFWVTVPFLNLLENMFNSPVPSKSLVKVAGAGMIGYVILLAVTLVQQKIETSKAVSAFDQHFPRNSQERTAALQLLAVKPGRGARKLLAALGGMMLVVQTLPQTETPAPEAGFHPIPIQADTSQTPPPTPAPQSRGGGRYIPLQPDPPSSGLDDGKRR